MGSLQVLSPLAVFAVGNGRQGEKGGDLTDCIYNAH